VSLIVNLKSRSCETEDERSDENTVYQRCRGGQSHFFKLRLRSCSKIFESGSGNFSNLSIRLQTTATIIDPTVIYPCFHLRNDHTD